MGRRYGAFNRNDNLSASAFSGWMRFLASLEMTGAGIAVTLE